MASESIYVDAFERAKPSLTYHALSSHLSLTKALTTDLSSYFTERALLESEYIKSLSKLSTRLRGSSNPVMSSLDSLGLDRQEEKRQLGAWEDVKKRLEEEVGETMRVHESWRKKVVDEVAGPLRSSLSKADWARMNQNEANLGGTVKEYESIHEKVQKVQGSKSSKSNTSKLLSAQSSLSTLVTSLTSSLPPFLSSVQSLDQSHGAFLKESLVKYGTISSDLGRERMEAGERLLVAVLGVDEGSEMQTWALRESMRAGATVARGREEFGMVGNGNGGGGREESIAEETASSIAHSEPRTQRAPPPVAALSVPPPIPAPSPSKSSGGGFKFSKILGGKRDRSSSNAAPSLDTRSQTRESVDSLPQPEDPTSSFRRQNSSTSGLGAGLQAPIEPDSTSMKQRRQSLMPFASGGLFRKGSKMQSGDGGFAGLGEEGSGAGGSGGEREFVESPMRELGQNEGGLTSVAQGEVDEEGYSVPPKGYDKQPWETNATGGGSANLMDEEDEDEAPSSVPKLPTVSIAPTTLTESDTSRRAALENVKSTLLSSGPSVTRRATTSRGRRDVRMTTYNPTIPDDVPLGKILEQQRASAMEGRSNSILSTVSSNRTTGATVVDPFEGRTSPGLRVSVVETVNVLIKGGDINRVMISGEIALSHRPTGTSSTPLKIRITNFERFEKAAPNGTYLTLVDSVPGEYTVGTNLGANTTTVLKYQLHVPVGKEKDYVPVLVGSIWKCEEKQTRVMVNYSRNEDVKFVGGVEESPFGEEETEVAEMEVHIPINVPITTFQAKPNATFSADKGRLSFALLTLEKEGGKLLASIQTEKLASSQPVVVRWKVAGKVMSGVGVEVVGGEKVEEVIRTTIAGKYLVAP